MSHRFSLIMATLNSQEYICDALNSVQEQHSKSIEVLLADGGSSDRTLEIARGFPFVRVLKGTDEGIYQGFNRGLEAVQGDIVGFLNSDDLLEPGAIDAIEKMFARDTDLDFVSGGVCFGNNGKFDGAIFNQGRLSVSGILHGVPAINARFIKRTAISRVGAFAPEAGLAADREFLLRMQGLGLKGGGLSQLLYRYRSHAGSATISGDQEGRARVWQAEIDLTNFILTQYADQPDIINLAKQSRILAKFKQRLAAVNKAAPLGHTSNQEQQLSLSEWLKLPAAIISWRQWRGKLSGY